MNDLKRIAELLSSIDGTLFSNWTSVFDIDEMNALLREILKEVKKSQQVRAT